MLRMLLLLTGLLGVGFSAWSQEYRAIDGTNNNLQNPTWGAADTEMPRLVPPAYGDGISALGGIGWPNPRVVSNTLFSQEEPLIDPLNLSDYCWAFGQFIDHDLTLVLDQANGWLFIQVPAGDPAFDPWGIGQALIPMRRSLATPGTGTDPANPRQHNNVITAFIDGSSVYGSSDEAAAWLRTFSEGKLKTSSGNLLPYNTLTGEYDGEIDPDAPHMDNPVGAEDKLFVAGDARANENVLLTTFHTLFMREHNRLCDSLLLVNPGWSDEQLYQHARKLVGGKIAAIVYHEWLPTMGVELPAYQGYDPAVDPRITNIFSAAAFRLGHTLLNENIMRVDEEGEVIPEGNLDLKDAFFIPSNMQTTGLEPLCKGMGIQVQQSMDGKVVSAIRNFLFGPPGAGGLDLASINMARGRERGIPDFNTVRQAMGLSPYTDFYDLTNKPDLAADMEDLYGSIDNCDAWTGFLIEDHMPNALFGPTLMKVLESQFAALRDGDRFYFENDPDLSEEEKATIRSTRMVDIVLNNTNLDIMQTNLFVAMPHEMLCTATNSEESINGTVALESGLMLEGIDVAVEVDGLGSVVGTQATGPAGSFSIGNVETCDGYNVIPSFVGVADDGVTTMDIVLVQKHILGLIPLDSPYKLIAADANNSTTITTLDIVEMRKVILQINTAFTNNTNWRFVDANYTFQDPENPLLEDFPEIIHIPNLVSLTNVAFVAIKVGDLNNSALGNSLIDTEQRSNEALLFAAEDQGFNAGETINLELSSEQLSEFVAFQFTLNYDLDKLEWLGFASNEDLGFGQEHYFSMPTAGAVTVSWNQPEEKERSNDQKLTLQFKALDSGEHLMDHISLNSRYTPAVAYQSDFSATPIELAFSTGGDLINVDNRYELYQNIPNPVDHQTMISFYLPEATSGTIRILDPRGQGLYQVERSFAKGLNTWAFERAWLNAPAGIYFYELTTDFGTISRSMVVID